MLRYLTPFLFLLMVGSTTAQVDKIQKPVKWEFSSTVISDTEAELVLTATINKGWHLYSQAVVEDGPIPTSFKFKKTSAFELIDSTKEGTPIKHKEPAFDNKELQFFENEAIFRQKIKINTSDTFSVTGELEFMVCNDNMCLPPEIVEFAIQVSPKKKSEVTSVASVSSGCSPWGTFIEGFLFGFIALITPCVYSMIPLTVSFFVKQSKTRSQGIKNALLYGASIVVIYVGLGMLITVLFGSDSLNELASNIYMNLFFFLIFAIFAASFLGAFEIVLPSSWVNKADRASDKGGIIGIFFMAFTLALVSFSCTGPIIGNLLVEVSKGGYLCPAMGMAGFASCLAMPFALFAMFPAWLNSLPKSGGWLNAVKVVLGFLELALALKFLSNADLVGQWHLISRELFIAIWIVVAVMIGFYLLGKLKFSHDSDLPYISVPRTILAILMFSFAVYLLPGMWGAPVSMISGFPPPETPDWSENIQHFKSKSVKVASPAEGEPVAAAHAASCPLDLDCRHDYEEALAYAKQVNKPVFVDFTGWTCVNCRKMEQKVWPDPAVLQRLQNDFVVVSLYVDDRTKLPEEYVSEKTKKKIKTKGNKWSELQAVKFGRNTQPWYELLDHEGNPLTSEGRGYDPDVEAFVKFLDEGKAAFQKKNNSHP